MSKRHRIASPRNLSELATRSLVLLCQRRLSAEGLARALGVSIITAKRMVAALRWGGFRVSSVRRGGRSWFEVEDARSARELECDPFLTVVVRSSASSRREGKAEDVDYDQD